MKTPNSNPKLVCHRGARLTAPENTLISMQSALEAGGHILEFDVRQSSDGVLYVLHDESVNRTTDGTGLIGEMNAQQIDSLDAGRWFGDQFEGQRVPRLDVFLDAFKNIEGFYVEVKQADCEKVADTIREIGVMDKCFTCSFDPQMRSGMQKSAPEMGHMLHWRTAGSVGVAIGDHGATMVEFLEDDLNEKDVAAALNAGLIVQMFCDKPNPEIYIRARDYGVQQFNMDHLNLFNDHM